MSLKGMWIDPADDSVVTLLGSPHASPERVAAIADKSDSGNHVAETGSPESAPLAIVVDGKRALSFDDPDILFVAPLVPSLLANFDGADGTAGSPEYVSEDVNAQVATFVSGAQLDTAQSKFGGSSLLVKGTADGVTFPDDAVYNFGSGDFTVEMWVRFDAAPTGNKMFIGQWTSGQLSWVWLIVSGLLRFDISTTGSSGSTVIDDAFVPSSGQWYHIAACRRGTEMEQWVDGVSIGTSSVIASNVLHDSTGVVEIGWYVAGGFGHDGWIEDVRVIKGEAIYSGDFIPPTAPHSATELRDMNGPDFTVIAAIGDHNRLISELIIDFDGVDGDTTYTSDDAVGRTVSFFGTAAIDNTQQRFGSNDSPLGTSLFLDGNSDYVTVPSASDLTLGTGDFTIEAWIRVTALSGAVAQIIYDQRTIATQVVVTFYVSNVLILFVNGSNVLTGTATLTVDTWHHAALTRKNGVTTIYLDGVADGSFTDTNNYIQNPVTIGKDGHALSNIFGGHIDSLRVVVGVALPPDVPVFGVTGDASPLDESGWRMNRSAMRVLAPSVGDVDTNVAPLDAPLEGDYIAAMSRDSVGNYLVGYASGVQGLAVSYSGTLGFAHDFVMGNLPGDILELIYVNRLLRTDERQRVEGYLAHKWNLDDTLHVGHPFALQAPDIVVDAALVANFNGADGDTSYTSDDSTARVATFVANAQLDNAQQKFGDLDSPLGTSLLLDGTGDYVSFPASTDFDLGSADFTLECWIRFNGDPGTSLQTFMAKWIIGSNQRSYAFGLAVNQLTLDYSENGTAVITLDSPWNPAGDTWYHTACVRRNGGLTFFVDGVALEAPQVMAETLHAPTVAFWVGANDNSGAAAEVDGHIDSVRVTVGTALYQYDFTPPHREFAIPAPAALLANFNGDDGISSPPGYVTEDVNAHSVSFIGTAQLDTAQKRFGKSSLLLDGNSDYGSIPHHADLVLTTTADFTIELWIRPDVTITATSRVIINKNGVQGSVWPNYSFSIGTGHLVTFSVFRNGGTNFSLAAVSTAPVGVWTHIAFSWVAADDTGRLFINGVLEDSAVDSQAIYDIGNPFSIGHQPSATNDYFPGSIDGIRVTQGIALYLATFDVPIDAPGEPIV